MIKVIESLLRDQRKAAPIIKDLKTFLNSFDVEAVIELLNFIIPPEVQGRDFIDPEVIQIIIDYVNDPESVDYDLLKIEYFIDMPKDIINYIELAGGLFLPEVNRIDIYIDKFGKFELCFDDFYRMWLLATSVMAFTNRWWGFRGRYF